MIFTFKQLLANQNSVWFFEDLQSNILCTCTAPYKRGEINVQMDFHNTNETVNMMWNPSSTYYGSTLQDRMCFRLFTKDFVQTGQITFGNVKVKGFLQSYGRRTLHTATGEFHLYEVGLGSKGIYACIYCADTLIAIAEKERVVVNKKDTYTIYMEDSRFFKEVAQLMLQYDISAYSYDKEFVAVSIAKTKLNTFSKELNSKYDPTYIERVKKNDGIL